MLSTRVVLFLIIVVAAFSHTSWSEERKLKTNDEIQLVVFGEDSLGLTVTIDSSGSVNFPLVGNVQVVGKTATEVAAIVEQRLEKDYIRDAHVTLSVVEEFIPKKEPKPVIIERPAPRPAPTPVVKVKKEPEKPKGKVTIMGEVKTPGTITFEGTSIDVLSIVAQARGLTIYANPKKVLVRRVDSGEVFTINLSDLQESAEQFLLKSGDTVTVSKRRF